MKIPSGKFLNCIGCNKECYMPKNRLQTFKYCSRFCKDKFGCTELIKANCQICNQPFEHISSRCNKAKYCSRLCYHRSQINKGTKEFTCFYCGKIFLDSPCKIRKFCSIECTGKSERSSWHPKYSTVRKKMIKEGMIEKCEKCGYHEIKEILGVHHIDHDRKNNAKENLMILCPMCHSIIHYKHICH